MTIVLKRAELEDSAKILETIVAAFEDYRGKFEPPSGVFTETSDSIRKLLEKDGGYIALVDEQIAGCVLYEAHDSYMYLGRLAVLAEFRGYGVARTLVEAVENRARELNFASVQLASRVSLKNNHAIFRHLGYELVRECKHDGYDEITYYEFQKWF